MLLSFKACFAQTVSLQAKSQPLEQVIKQLRAQTDYAIMAPSAVLAKGKTVTVNLNKVTIEQALKEIFKNQPATIDYEIKGKNIIIRDRTVAETEENTKTKKEQPAKKSGSVVDQDGKPLAGATVKLIDGTSVTTNGEGRFFINSNNSNIVTVTMLGFEPLEIYLKSDNENIIQLNKSQSVLDEAIVMGYGITSKRFNTGSIERISTKEIESQPVSNLLSTLSGRVPGILINQSTGVAGGKIRIEVQGRNNLDPGTVAEPLIIIDGVPFAAQNDRTNRMGSTDLSPLSLINPNDIASIEVLKDADATAIYGSRGAYGVILISTKKGTIGKTTVTASQNFNINSPTRKINLLNTEQYLEMRKEAFANDGVTPDIFNAPDLVSWDQTTYTNWQKELIGNKSYSKNTQLSISGGSKNTRFLLSGNYLNEDLLFKHTKPYSRLSTHSSLDHTSENSRFNITFSAGYNKSTNNTTVSDLTGLTILLPPNYPKTLDENGNLIWEYDGVSLYYGNPYDYTKQKYQVTTKGLTTNLSMSYKIFKDLTARINSGYNSIDTYSEYLIPKSAGDPQYNPTGYMSTGNNNYDSWLMEPQLEYNKTIYQSKLSVLIGSTFQQTKNDIKDLQAIGFTTDDLLGSLGAASSYTASSYSSDYRYSALFGRINYNLNNRYIINLSGRRDGSSRFSPGHRFGNFGAVGLGWIFTEDGFIKEHLPLLSFGKLRTSYGITGSDKIGDYKYMDSWRTIVNPYLDIKGIYPVRLANQNFIWESNKKFAIGLELGFLKDHIFFNAGYFDNRSSNQLINTPLPNIAGFSTIIENFPATIQNKGWEISLLTTNLRTKEWSWNTNFNITIPKNKLLEFPGIETSNYANTYIIGKSLNLIRAYTSKGVDPQTGIFTFKDVNGDGLINQEDRSYFGTTDPKFYGGLQNTLGYKGFSMDLFFEFRKQTGLNYLSSIYQGNGDVPGFLANFPDYVLDRWQQPGDITNMQKFSANYGTEASDASLLLGKDVDIKYSDASFIRLKTVSLSYTLPSQTVSKLKINGLRFSIRAQNLFTITDYKGADPEIQNLRILPPLRTISFGIELSL
ncbi:SusC/RagA family TonB-linked outer membrane protein [Sphingobacterium faecium NBRC 15299]|nr:SusC/RagA family TonB-linked outer membrane protein [Sphingobacterium faecium NBRC 15299]